MRVATYARLSEDPDGLSAAPARQREDCLRFAEARGWDVVLTLEDLDISAFKRVRRPAFDQLLEAIRTKQVDGVVAWKLDRLTRQQRDLVRLTDACEAAGGAFVATVVDGIDTSTNVGRFVAELLTAQARMESANTATRVHRHHQQRAREGKPSGGGIRAFGWTKGRAELVPEEVTLIQEAAHRVLNGESIRGIALDWARRGVGGPTGKAWQPSSLRRMLAGWPLAGVRDYEGTQTAGTWPAILERSETERLRAILLDPARRNAQRARRSYLLTGGIARCGRCGEALIGGHGRNGARRYTCARIAGRPNCGGLARMAEPVEATVAEMLFSALDGVNVSAFLHSDGNDDQDRLAATIRADEEALVRLADDHYVQGAITRGEFFSARTRLTERLEANRQALARTARASVLAAMTDIGAELRARWAGEGLEWRRAVVEALIDSVTIAPTRSGRAPFDPSAITVRWKF